MRKGVLLVVAFAASGLGGKKVDEGGEGLGGDEGVRFGRSGENVS